MVCAHCAFNDKTANNSAHSVEVKLLQVTNRHGKSGKGNSGQVTRWYRGYQVASDRSIIKLISVFPDINEIYQSQFWKILDEGLNTMKEVESALNILHDDAFWVCHSPNQYRLNVKSSSIIIELNEQLLHRLVVQGSMDSLIALYAHTMLAQLNHYYESAIYIASYIPVALALMKRDRVFDHTIEIIFCRLRQLVIDGIISDKKSLWLQDYNLEEILIDVPENLPMKPNPANPHIIRNAREYYKKTKLDPKISKWIENSRPQKQVITKNQKKLGKWKDDLFPSKLYSKDSNSYFPFANMAVDIFTLVLKDYWAPIAK